MVGRGGGGVKGPRWLSCLILSSPLISAFAYCGNTVCITVCAPPPPCSPVVVQYVESGDGEEDLMSGLQSEKYTQEMLRAIFSGMHTVLTAALRQPGLKTEV